MTEPVSLYWGVYSKEWRQINIKHYFAPGAIEDPLAEATVLLISTSLEYVHLKPEIK